MQEFFANGKLLLTGEYVVLDGALAISLPTKLGQSLQVKEELSEITSIHWKALLNDGSIWFEAIIDEDLNIISSSDKILGENILHILRAVQSLNHGIFNNKKLWFTTKLDFPTHWGLGSSSTLITLLANYSNLDAFKLLEITFGGSGYDISCALFPKTQTYQLTTKGRKVNLMKLDKNITQHCYFIHLKQKQNSREGINRYRQFDKDKHLIKSISDLSLQIKNCKDLAEFEDILYVHEYLLSEFLSLDRIQDSLFPDYKKGIIKSLGAWGGDFVLVTNEDSDLSYFEKKGYTTIFPYHDLIID